MSLKKRNDYDVSFRKAVKHLHEEPPESRGFLSHEMCEQYYDDHGDYPADYFLEKMADALLHETLSNSSPGKMKREEYPILSESQLNRRKNGGNKRNESKRYEVPFHKEEIDKLLIMREDISMYPECNKVTLKAQVTKEVDEYDQINEEQPVTTYFTDPSSPIDKRKNSEGRGDGVQQWAATVKERDRYRCQNPMCDRRAGIMHAHHIHNYADYPELRMDTDNGVTLCEPCHYEFHGIYGKYRTNEEDLKEFFGETLYLP
ncbi:HNH endonuclease [Thalassobacillus sp. CUG 92003]|uniref:HNH endonuclease n=1 Tax=Thalassobacillus sp. CUG 92003 TaxID=2736641 RepID=UPI0015E76D14|nr:HNH endonuclease signature motif containing protein [Thalassobacillus sp. CUG 92003]